MRVLLVAAILFFGASHATSEESPRQTAEQASKTKTNQEPAGAFEQAGRVVPFWFASQPQTIQVISEKKAESACEPYTLGEFFAVTWCELRTYPEALTALGTLILAFGTFFLAVSTHTAARAAKVAAEHIPIVEGAHVYLVIKQDEVFEQLQTIGHEAAPPNFAPVVRVALRNFGKTPAFVERFNARISFVSSGGAISGIETRIQPNTIIAAERETEPPSVVSAPELSKTDAEMVWRAAAHLILEGTFVYRDILGGEWIVRFDGRTDNDNGRFRLDNYPRKKNT